MTIHLICNSQGEVFGLYKDRKLVVQKRNLQSDEILNALEIHNDLILFDEEEMKTLTKLPGNLDDIEITSLLGEGATIATIQEQAWMEEQIGIKEKE